jgi:hypothetical protein
MKQVFISFLLLLLTTISFALPYTDSLINKLNNAIKQSDVYDQKKLKKISQLKSLLNENADDDINKQYNICLTLYEEYKYYNYDSAFNYTAKLRKLAGYKNDPSLIADAKVKMVFVMVSGGLFKETFDSLNVISLKVAADTVKAEYYSLIARSYYNLADFNSDNVHSPYYNNKGNFYLDSALDLYSPNSFDYVYYSALRLLKKGSDDSALSDLNNLIVRKNLSRHQIALATSTIGGILMSQGREDKAKPFLVEASIADIQSSTKETLALLNLANIIFKEGNIKTAALFIEKANTDAAFYNARLRKVQIGTILPIIEGEMINTIQTQKQKLIIYLLLLAFLVLLLVAFAIIIRNQVKKLKAIRIDLLKANVKQQQINHELTEANELKEKYNNQLKEINNQLVEANATKEKFNKELQKINNRLSEANKIKEEYIGYYFNMDNEFLSRIEKLIKSIDKKLPERKWEEIKFIVNSVNLKKDKEELLKNFDKIFVRLFPNFVTQFNTLFTEEDKIILKEDQLLNTELRIFALMRLGITENEKIAEILDYSINTIYSKKTKIRSKTIIPKDEFEKKIMELTTLSF